MKARIIKNKNGESQILCYNGTIAKFSQNLFAKLLTNFKSEFYIDRLTGKLGQWNTTVLDMTDYPGKTQAYISDNYQMVLVDPELLIATVSSTTPYEYVNEEEDNLISLSEYAKKHNRSEAMIKVYCREGRISGARKASSQWLIPENAPYPIPPHKRKR